MLLETNSEYKEINITVQITKIIFYFNSFSV